MQDKKVILQVKALLISYYKEYREILIGLKHLVDLAILDDYLTEKAIISLVDGLNVKFKYEQLNEFAAFMLSDEALELWMLNHVHPVGLVVLLLKE